MLPGLGVTGFTKRQEIVLGMSTAAIQRQDVMDFIGRDETIHFEALFAEWMFGDVNTADLTPTVIVVLRVAMGTIILPAGYGFMSGTILTFPDRRGTAGVGAGFVG